LDGVNVIIKFLIEKLLMKTQLL